MRLLTLLLVSALAAPTFAAAQTPSQPTPVPYAPPTNSAILHTTFVDFDSLIPTPTAAGLTRPVFDNPTPTIEKLEVHVTTLNPGQQSHPIHSHPWEEILLIKEGSLDISINGTPHHAGPGAMVFLASNDPHNARNTGSTPATYYVINFFTDLVHTVASRPAAQQAIPGKLASTVVDTNTLKTTPTPTGSRVTVLDSPTLTFLAFESHITTLNPNQHTTVDIIDPGDEFLLLRSGQVEVTVNGIASRMNAGSFVYWAPNDKRTIRNLGPTPASYQVIRVTSARSPKPPAN